MPVFPLRVVSWVYYKNNLTFTGIPGKMLPMKIYIPNAAFLGNINTFLSAMDLNDDGRLEITTNPKWISVHPLVLSMIASLGKPIKPENITCDDIMAPSGHYLKRMGLFDFLGIKPKVKDIQEHEPAGRLIPLKQIKSSGDLNSFLKELVPLLHLQKDPQEAEAIQHIFSELIRNVLEHAQTPQGAIVCAQYFRKSNKIAIGVADIGIGLKKAIQKSYSVKDDLDAIRLALTPGVTGTTNRPGGTAENAGFGLFLVKSIAYTSSDFFTIISGNMGYKLLKSQGQKGVLHGNPLDDRYTQIETPYWKGVAVGVDISLTQTQEFSSLLGNILKFYSSQVKNQKRERYKKPKFI